MVSPAPFVGVAGTVGSLSRPSSQIPTMLKPENDKAWEASQALSFAGVAGLRRKAPTHSVGAGSSSNPTDQRK